MGVNSRSKGNKNERVIAKVLKKWTGKEFARTPSSGGLQWKSTNSKGDVVCTEEGYYFPFCIEGKCYTKIDFSHLLIPNIKNVLILDFWKQCKGDADKAKKIPMLMMRYNGLPKEFFFICVDYTLFDFCIKPLSPFCNYIEYKTDSYHLAIFPSQVLFNIPFSRVKNVFRNYARNLEERIKTLPFNKRYQISNRGYLINTETGDKKFGTLNGNGRIIATLIDENKNKKTITLYRWVAKLFVKNPKNKPLVNHIKPIKSISDARNLEWVSNSENIRHHTDNVLYDWVIDKIDPTTNLVIDTYNTPLNAARAMGKSTGSTIVKVIKGKRKTAYKFIWKKRTL